MKPLADRCKEVLLSNDRGGHTLPSPHLYPHQWAWDSAFAAIGWAHIDLDRALVELETLMQGAWDDGRVPHIFFHDLSGDYFPGPEFWHTKNSSTITQPPVWAMAARRLYEMNADKSRIAALLPAIEASHQFFANARDPQNRGAVAVVHPWESGLDNSPAWDAAMQKVDPSRSPAFTRVDTERVEDASQRPTDDDYKRYTVLVEAIAQDDFGQGEFAVYDPLMSSILARAEQDLAWLSDKLGRPSEAASRRSKLIAGLESLWDADAGRYCFHDARSDQRETPDVLAAYTPLMLEGPHQQVLQEGLKSYLDTPWPLPSVSPRSEAFDSRCYWRGPTWINMNWLLAPYLPTDIRQSTIKLVEQQGFREYYDPTSGEGLGAKEFTWTAALVLDWLST
jgi:glycogen debranching enzyme